MDKSKAYLLNFTFLTMKRPLALIGFSYFITLVVLNYIPDSNIIIVACGLFIALIISFLIKKFRNVENFFCIMFLSCLAATFSYVLNSGIIADKVKNLDETDIKISGTICDIPYKKNNNYNYILNINEINEQKIKPFKIILRSHSSLNSDICDIFTGHVHISSIENNISQAYKMHCKSRNIYAQAFFYEYMGNSNITPQSKSLQYYILYIRKEFSSNFRKIFTSEISSVINAIFLGEKNSIPYEIKINFDKIGIYHLLTTSGIHISILAQTLLWIFKKFKLKNKFSYVLCAIIIFSLEVFTGFAPSTTKSGTVMIIYLLGMAIARKSDALNSLGIAVFIMCLINPNYACSVGLLLSVFSTLGIIFLYNPIKNKLKFNVKSKFLYKLINYITSSISLSLAVIIFTTPLTVLYYGKIAIISVISNILVYPLAIIIIFGATYVNFLFSINSPIFLIEFPAYICGTSAKIIIKISEFLSKIPYASLNTDYGIFHFCLLCILILFSLALCSTQTQKYFKITFLLSLNLIFISIFSYQIHERNSICFSIIPCGDGLSLIISKNEHTAAFIQLKEKTNIENIQNYFSKCNIFCLDYLYISSIDSTKKYVVKNIAKNYNPQTIAVNNHDVIAQENLFKDLNYNVKSVYFEDELNSKFWDNISCEFKEINNKIFIKIISLHISFLVIPDGGDASKLPESWKECDFLILSGIPLNCQKIRSKNIILSTNMARSKIGIYKLSKPDSLLYSLPHQGIIHINLNSKGKYNIRRLK